MISTRSLNWAFLWDEALGSRPKSGEKVRSDRDFALAFSIPILIATRAGLSDLKDLLDPDQHRVQLTGSPGWRLWRQMRRGELFEKRKYDIARFRSAQVAIRPDDPDAGPYAEWPEWARFCASLDDPGEFGDPDHPQRYYDAATFESLVGKVLALYAERNPEHAPVVAQCQEFMRYWVERDAESAPGLG